MEEWNQVYHQKLFGEMVGFNVINNTQCENIKQVKSDFQYIISYSVKKKKVLVLFACFAHWALSKYPLI